ncbi:hypothetical protein EC2861200_5135, partial [Escherichia coli 2861200]
MLLLSFLCREGLQIPFLLPLTQPPELPEGSAGQQGIHGAHITDPLMLTRSEQFHSVIKYHVRRMDTVKGRRIKN